MQACSRTANQVTALDDALLIALDALLIALDALSSPSRQMIDGEQMANARVCRADSREQRAQSKRRSVQRAVSLRAEGRG